MQIGNIKEVNKFIYIAFLFLAITLSSCKHSIDDFNTYMEYLADKDNGLVKEKSIGGIQLKVKYLPNDYLVYNEVKNNKQLTENLLDSLKLTYANSITFMMVLGPDKNESFDITRVGVANYEEFAQRIEEMNFNMMQHVKLQVGNEAYSPELYQMESTYGLEQSRKFLFVFKAKDEKSNTILKDDFQFVYADELFNTGINKFQFKHSDVNAIPTFNFSYK
ncbi:MAG: hypothetical protein CMD31_12930 [Flavobacteriales bacterium]|nr:hypothetical protein [Flavobacteriales bacterium]|tara:strand:+ start:1032 stop:1691 length:660 start_codon:yes stop_codon:yes gene_type:complete